MSATESSPANSLPAGTPCWTDLATPNAEGAKAFYAAVLGWAFGEEVEELGGYMRAQKDGKDVAGINPNMGDLPFSAWTLYFSTDDIDATSQAVMDNGGQVVAAPMPVQDMGKMMVATDPLGGAFGAWQPGTFRGAEVFNSVGALTWEDLRSRDPESSREFYSALFPFVHAAVAMDAPGDYKTFGFAGAEKPLGGIGDMMGAPEGIPSHWLVYFRVEDAAAAAARVRSAGGDIYAEGMSTPFGRIAAAADPFGASFIIIDSQIS